MPFAYLGRNENDAITLALLFALNDIKHFGISCFQGLVQNGSAATATLLGNRGRAKGTLK